MIHHLPGDSTLEDIQYHLYVLEKIRKGQESIKDGKGISHEEAKLRLAEPGGTEKLLRYISRRKSRC